MSYNGIGLSSARGSGTNGYVVRNLSTLKHRQRDFKPTDHYDDEPKRSIEIKCATLQDELEDEGLNEAEIDKQVDALREKLTGLLHQATAAAALAITQAAEREAAMVVAAKARAEQQAARAAAAAETAAASKRSRDKDSKGRKSRGRSPTPKRRHYSSSESSRSPSRSVISILFPLKISFPLTLSKVH
ncbi:RNA-splicing factor [Mortierella sp. AD032]|nr:RNA-splicing factor [Mortierella sp. AD032]